MQALTAQLGLDRPLGLHYVSFLGQTVTGDFGQSFQFGRSAIGVGPAISFSPDIGLWSP